MSDTRAACSQNLYSLLLDVPVFGRCESLYNGVFAAYRALQTRARDCL